MMVLGGAAPGAPMFLLEAAAGREQKESWKGDTLPVLLVSCHLECDVGTREGWHPVLLGAHPGTTAPAK